MLALVAAPGSLGVEFLLKQVVHRQRPDSEMFLYPSGHVAVATAAAVTAVLVARATPVAPRTRAVVAWLAGGFVVVIAVARLVQTVHCVTDAVGGVATGLVVTLGDHGRDRRGPAVAGDHEHHYGDAASHRPGVG